MPYSNSLAFSIGASTPYYRPFGRILDIAVFLLSERCAVGAFLVTSTPRWDSSNRDHPIRAASFFDLYRCHMCPAVSCEMRRRSVPYTNHGWFYSKLTQNVSTPIARYNLTPLHSLLRTTQNASAALLRLPRLIRRGWTE